MRLLFDTNVLLALLDERHGALDRPMHDAVTSPDAVPYVSVASLWEIALKVRLGKLVLRLPLALLPELIQRTGFQILVINHHHVLAIAEPEPATRDPFDRLLLAQCLIENLRLVTIDRVLVKHPLAWRAA